MQRLVSITGILLTLGCNSGQVAPVAERREEIIASVFSGGAGKWVDLTHSFSARSVYWPTDTMGFKLEELAHGHTPGGWFYSSYRFSSAEHGGTHLDAPIHFAEGASRMISCRFRRSSAPQLSLTSRRMSRRTIC